MGLDDLRRTLADRHLLFLDTMVFSYHLGDHADYVPLTTLILDLVEEGTLPALTTTLTIAELLTRPAQEGNRQAMRDYRLYLANFPNLRIIPLDISLAEKAALVRAETGLRLPDAIQIAAARSHGADAIITNDRAWPGRFPTPAVLLLDDYRKP